MTAYLLQQPVLLAVDCIVFGFDGKDLNILLIKRNFDPEQGRWSLMGGFLKKGESLPDAANRVLKTLTGLEGVYLEQSKVFCEPDRDPAERVISMSYFALIDINKYEHQVTEDYEAKWFLLDKKPRLVFDHDDMVRQALHQLRYKAALHPLLFELLPERFTIPQLQALYEAVYDTVFDNRNFTRKLISTGLLIKQTAKDKSGSKKGAYLYKLDKRKYKKQQGAFLNLIPRPDKLL
ncbi:ADP-ribose pyrophosphatase YjhB, NUDIX family [Cnuella takakiae]|uniref:ADP-ribose pyrophosphatase YjhB, NUDIX family n=1 Tax=Cnuella takakiae TaxID=1302690 RepID=A0A1M5GFT7_9BACT|nr:NUDIX domain-containing protein [Cnuella takakiae]OLY94788.1 DNA mismatch repair protein MutT [Cnuella takakiae]SHG02558.1 ADP-ribose pyrophosphatase YjhB, NUDIX family [Cnuella takakiae]